MERSLGRERVFRWVKEMLEDRSVELVFEGRGCLGRGSCRVKVRRWDELGMFVGMVRRSACWFGEYGGWGRG